MSFHHTNIWRLFSRKTRQIPHFLCPAFVQEIFLNTRHPPDRSGSPSTSATVPLFLAQLLSPQVCCGLFLNSCYSGATVCAWNIKHPLLLIPPLTVGNWNHHWLIPIPMAAHASVKCQSKCSHFLFLFPWCLVLRVSQHTHTNTQSFPICLCLAFITPAVFSSSLFAKLSSLEAERLGLLCNLMTFSKRAAALLRRTAFCYVGVCVRVCV